MTIRATVLRDSTAPSGKRLTTLELYYPRAFIHEELLTHRALSRNASSSRATPVSAMVNQVRTDPAIPVRWGLSGKGMQDHGEMSKEEAAKALEQWIRARDEALLSVGRMENLTGKPHKQISNLLLRPWEHITVVVSSTEWANFFGTRRHSAAKPEFYELADKMYQALGASIPNELQPGEWHLPYIAQYELDAFEKTADTKRDVALGNLIKVSAARCARTSFKNHRGKVAGFVEDVELYNRLAGDTPMHASPLEHQATPDTFRFGLSAKTGKMRKVWDNGELHGNFVGFVQHRKTLPGENITRYVPETANV